MSTITFDTLKFARRLTDAGVPAAQAEAEAFALSDALEVNMRDLAGKQDLVEMERRMGMTLDSKFALLEAKIDKLYWVMGILVALAGANFAKQFF